MQCASFQEQLSDFLDGELSAADQKTVEKHLKTCAVCSTVRDDLARLIAASANLPLHTPSQAVWSRIEREIGGGRVVAGPLGWWSRLNTRKYDFSVSARQLVAAAATIVVAVGAFWAIRYTSPNSLPTIGVNWSSMGGSSQGVQAVPLAHVTPVDEVSRLRGLVEDMSRSVGESQVTWSPELRSTFAKAVAAADVRIAEDERAVAVSPSESARESLASAYRDKLRLLDEFARLATAQAAPRPR